MLGLYSHVPPCLIYTGQGIEPRVSVHARQVLYPLSYTPTTTFNGFLKTYQIFCLSADARKAHSMKYRMPETSVYSKGTLLKKSRSIPIHRTKHRHPEYLRISRKKVKVL